MDKDEQNYQSTKPPSYSPTEVGPGLEITATDTAIALHETQPEQREKAATPSPPNATDSIVPVEAPTKSPPVLDAPRVVSLEQLFELPQLIDCPFCQYRALTRVIEEDSSETSTAALLCCIFGGICCAFLPYLCKWSQEYHHFCSHCGAKVAIRPPSGPVQVQRPMPPPSMPSRYPAAPPIPAPAVYR